ncbi:MAG: hypothetical protein JSW09_10495 [Pseudomonadota bacterium]|nr:MAG: hypothetical protein JSW09_10495 [Pseudomonadota bacterium]
MDTNRWAVASVAVAVVVAVVEMVIHGALLQETYQQTATVWRPMSESRSIMPLMWLGYAIFAPFFVYIYAKGLEPGKPPLEQGMRFGIIFGTGLSAMNSLIWYVVLPIPVALAWAWFIAGIVVFLAAGVAAGLTYKPEGPARAQPDKKAAKKRRGRR